MRMELLQLKYFIAAAKVSRVHETAGVVGE